MRSLYLPILLSIPLTLAAQDNNRRRDRPSFQRGPRTAQTSQAGTPGSVPLPGSTGAVPSGTAQPAAADGNAAPPPVVIPRPGTATPSGATGTTPGTPAANSGIPVPNGGTATPRPGLPRAGTGPAALPSGANSASGAGEGLPPDPNNPWGDIAFVDADINEVLDKYMEITQRHVLRPADLQGKVNLVANLKPLKPFTRDEAADFIKAGLALQNFVIQRYNDTTDKVLMLQAAPPLINGLATGEPIYTNVDDLPEEDVVVNFVLTLKHLPAVDASQVLAAAVPVRQWTKYIPVASANAIFIQEFTSNIRTLVKVAKGLDLPPIKMVHEWVELERASAEDVQTILDQILQAQSQGRSGSGNQGGIRTISPAAAAASLQPGGAPAVPVSTGGGASSGMMPDGSQVIVRADPRTNRVFLNGPEEHVKFLRGLIREFDEPSRVKNLLTQQLRYIPVNDFFGLAVTSLEATGAGQAGSGSAGGGAAGGARSTGGRSTDGSSTGGGSFRQDFASRSGSSSMSGGGFSSSGVGGSSRSSGGRSSSSRSGAGTSGGVGGQFEAPQAQTVGKTLLISDPRTNSLIVSGPPDSIQRISDLVKEMDRRPFQVHINAFIAQMALGDDLTTSVDILRQPTTFNIFGEKVDASGFYRTATSGSFIDPTSLSDLTKIPTVNGLNFYAAAGDLFNSYVRLIEGTNRSKLLAKPHITVANNQTGTISSGERVPIPSNQQSTVVAGGTTSLNSSIEYENVVLELNVTPLINSRNEITLHVEQLNDTVNGTTEINGNQIPNISTQQLITDITIPNGAILVLGGLLSDQDRKTRTGIPIISKIPVLRSLVGSNVRNKQRRELLILLQARIEENADDLVDVSTHEIQRTVIGPEALKFARPERNTDNVKLPTYENDVPYNTQGATTTSSGRSKTVKGKK